MYYVFMLLETSPQGMVGAAGRNQITVSISRLVIQDNRIPPCISHEQLTYFFNESFLASAQTPACYPCMGHTVHDNAMAQGSLAGICSDRIPVPRRVSVRDKTTLPNTSKFKMRGRDDIDRPKHTFAKPDFEYKKIPM